MKFVIQRQVARDADAMMQTRGLRVLDVSVLRIGRATGCDLRFEDASVSRQHASIHALEDDSGFLLIDEGSLTGTYVNGERIERRQIEDGDVAQIGSRQIRFTVGQAGRPLQITLETDQAGIDPQAGTALASAGSLGVSGKLSSMPGGRPPRSDPPISPTPTPPSPSLPAASAPASVPAAAGARAPRSAAPPRSPSARQAPLPGIVAAIDYAAAYRLDIGPLTRVSLSVGAGLLALLLVSVVALADRNDFVQPGPISRAHQIISGASDCSSCHTAWRGVDSQSCECCHSGPEHVETQVFAPDCQECHVEHRFQSVLHRTRDRSCTRCHADLEVAAGETAQFVTEIHRFERDHPDFRLSIRQPSGEIVRVPIAQAVDQKTDRAKLALNHQLHLDPTRLAGKQLECASCHVESPDEKLMQPVTYEEHCQSCHELNFDKDYDPAPHLQSVRVYEHILASYALEPTRGTTRTEPATPTATRDTRLIRKSLIFNRREVTIEYDEQTERSAFVAADRLFKAACDKCHELVGWGAWPPDPPRIVPVALPRNWMPFAEFSHDRHGVVECRGCHSAAPTSTETSDVLLEGIETCLPCHGGARDGVTIPVALAEASGSATTDCVSCHLYHDQTKKQDGWVARQSCQRDAHQATEHEP